MKLISALVVALAVASSASARNLLQQAPAPGPAAQLTDVDILNFALNLEYLEAEFYSCAATGQPLPSELRGGGPASTGCQKAGLGVEAQAIAEEIAQDEADHVRFLRNALGAQAVAIPQLDIGSAFSTAADAATTLALNPEFSPYANDIDFYIGAFIFEDVGTTAYSGAAPLIKNRTILGSAARILPVEGYHAGIIRTQLYNVRDFVTPYNVTVAQIVEDISALRDSVDGAQKDDTGIETADGAIELVPVNSQGLVYTRTPEQVIDIVTLGSPNGAGGFFPNGLNGYFAASS